MARKILEERGMHSISEQIYGNPDDSVSEESTEKSGVNSDTHDRTLGLTLNSSDKRQDENLQIKDVILFNTAKDLNNTENKSCSMWERKVDVTVKTSGKAENENFRFKKRTSKFLSQNSYGKELEDLTVKDRIISVTAQTYFSKESEVEGLIVKKETAECTLKTSNEAEVKDLRVNSETLKITTKTHTSAGMEVEYLRVEKRTVDSTAQMSDHAEIKNFRVKKESWEVTVQSCINAEAENRTVKDGTAKSIHSIASEVLTVKDGTAKSIHSIASEVLTVKDGTAKSIHSIASEVLTVKDGTAKSIHSIASEVLTVKDGTAKSIHSIASEVLTVKDGTARSIHSIASEVLTVKDGTAKSIHSIASEVLTVKDGTAKSIHSIASEVLTVKDGTAKSIHSIASEVLTGKEETVELIAKADFKEEVGALSVDEEFVKIPSAATYKEECDSYRAECYVSEREEEVESYNNIVPSIELVIGQYFSDCVKSGDLTKPSLQETYRSEGHADDDKKNDFFSYQDIHKGRYQQDEFDEILESITKKEEQGYDPRERKHALSGEREVPCFLDDKKRSNSYPSVSVQQEFTPVTSTEESLLLDTEEPHDTSFLKCGEINEKNSDVSLRNIEIFSDFISLESEKKKVFCSELHFRDMGNPSGFVSQKSNKKTKEGLIHLKEGVKLQSCRRQLLSSSVKAFFETGNTCLHQVKDASEIEQQILSDMGVEVQKEKYMAEIDEKTPRDIDLKEKKKHHLRQIVWLPRNWLPLPRLGRDEIVGFVEEQTHNGRGGSTLPPAEHEELREMLRLLASDNVPGPHITMKYEMLRLCTMKTFPGRDRPFAIRIVGAGFYYAGHKDQVICYCCGSRKDSWVLGDIPLLNHQNMASGCGFLTHNALVNVPIRKADCTESPSPTEVRLLAIQGSDGSNQSDTAQGESSLMLPSSEQTRISISNMSHQMLVTNKSLPPNQLISLGRQNVLNTVQTVSTDTYSMEEVPPKYPQYAVKNMRVNSFQGWPAELRQKPEEMAECGFYYAGFSDCVRCFFCGVGLQHWLSEDNPWIEHARWSASCMYVLRMKGEEFVTLVMMAVEIAEREEAARNNSGGNQASQDSNVTAPTAVIQEGTEELTGQIIMEAAFEIDKENKLPSKTQPVCFESAEGDKSGEKDVCAVSDLKRREVTCAWKEWMTPATMLKKIDGSMDSKWYLNISQNYLLFQRAEFTVCVIPLPPRHYFQIYIRFQGAFLVSNEDDQITHELDADAYAARQIGYTTDPITTIAPTAFEIDNMRLGGPISLIEQETDQQATYRYGSGMTQNDPSRAICSRENDDLPAHILPPICSSRSSGQSSLTAGSGFEQEQSPIETESPRDFYSLGDAHGKQDIYSIQSTGHDHSCSQQTSNDQKEVAALKESEAVHTTENQTSVSAPSPKYPHYKDKNARIASFQGCPAELQAEEMAECGFYYAGFSDCVHCFHCGVGLRNWMSEDDPWIEHARWSAECMYVLRMKGEEFVTLVKMAVEIAEREEAVRNIGEGNQALQNSNETAPAVPAKKGHEASGNTQTEESQLDPEKIMREHRELREATVCKICLENTISVVFLPCGHHVTCSDCAPAMRKCPICRTLIKGIVKTFFG